MVGWIVAGAIVVVGLLGLGFRDLLRLSPARIWAIGGVCFRESIRRRVLWIIPLAIVGAVIVSQLQKAIDEQDVIRQTTKFCLFAAGLVVTMTIIILGCTNLPREIETRVIYTIVTKPTTRLELILGKIVGFARVSGLILIIMGAFTYGYLQLRAWNQQQLISVRLNTDSGIGAAERNKLSHYLDTGLLTAREYQHASLVEVMAPVELAPAPGTVSLPTPDNSIRSFFGGDEEELSYPIHVDLRRLFTDTDYPEPNDIAGIGKNGILIGVRVRWHRYGPETTDPAHKNDVQPHGYIAFDLLDSNGINLVNSVQTFDPRYPAAKDAHTQNVELPAENAYDTAGPFGAPQIMWAYVPPDKAAGIFKQPLIYIHIYGNSNNVQYFADAHGAFLMMCPPPAPGKVAPPIPSNLPPDQLIFSDPGPDGQPSPPLVHGRTAAHGGQGVIGKSIHDTHAPVAICHFENVRLPADSQPTIAMEFIANVERGGDLEEKSDAATDVTLYLRPSGEKDAPLSAPIDLKVENKQTVFAELPVSSMGVGDFDLIIRCNTPGNELGLEAATISLISGRQPFAWNMAKSLLILWLLTVLVISLAVMSSTFVSWPIAVVLTFVLLMGHWAVTQVADTADKTLGRNIATDMGLTDASKAEAVANSVNALSGTLQIVGVAMPDIDRFAAISSIEQGAVVSIDQMSDALGVVLGFALPAAVLAYLILKQKEVAP